MHCHIKPAIFINLLWLDLILKLPRYLGNCYLGQRPISWTVTSVRGSVTRGKNSPNEVLLVSGLVTWTHKRFQRTLFIMTKHNMQIFWEAPFSSYKTTLKQQINSEKWYADFSFQIFLHYLRQRPISCCHTWQAPAWAAWCPGQLSGEEPSRTLFTGQGHALVKQ